MGFRSRLLLAQGVGAATAVAVSIAAVWAAAAYHPGKVMILLGYGPSLAAPWALAGLLFYLPRKVREAARMAQASALADPRTRAFLEWADRERLTDQD